MQDANSPLCSIPSANHTPPPIGTQVRGEKVVLLDQDLSGPLGLMVESSQFREGGVQRMYRLEAAAPESPVQSLLYIVRPTVQNSRLIAGHIHAYEKIRARHEFSVFFVPRRTMICERVLEEESVLGSVTLGEYHLDLVPFDDDVLSLELPKSHRELFLDGDHTALFYAARSLMKLQTVAGVIPRVRGKGKCARQVADMLSRMRKEQIEEDTLVTPEIDQLILIDRDVDYVSVMLTQLTYEGLMDEMIGVKDSRVELPTEIVTGQKAKSGQPEVAKHPLNSNDTLYQEIRDLHFGILGPLLNQKARTIDENYRERHDAKTVTQIRDFMKKLPSLQREHHSLRIHTAIAEKILQMTKDSQFHRRIQAEHDITTSGDAPNEYIEELIYRKADLTRVLRLLCLTSLCDNGMKSKLFDFYRREVMQTYGYEHMFTFSNLEKLGLFKRQDKGVSILNVASSGLLSEYSQVRKAFKLEVSDLDEQRPQDLAYVFSGYAPLSCRFVQQLTSKEGLRPVSEALKLLPGPEFDIQQDLPSAVRDNSKCICLVVMFIVEHASKKSGQKEREVILVFFIGGVTFAEIAALRWLSQQSEGRRDFVVASTRMINGDTLLNDVVEHVVVNEVASVGKKAGR